MKEELNKKLFIQELSNRCDYTIKDTRKFVNEMIGLFRDCILEEIPIGVQGFGNLYYQTLPPRRGYKPIKGKPGEGQFMDFPESTRAIFKLASSLRKLTKYSYVEDGEEEE